MTSILIAVALSVGGAAVGVVGTLVYVGRALAKGMR